MSNIHNQPEYTVSELSGALKRVVENSFGYVRVRGEISGFKRAASGHLYLDLKDDSTVLNAVCWKGVAGRLGVNPEDGLEVICTGKLTTYGARSSYQLVIEAMEIAGEGALMALLEKRKKQLAAEGLFDESRKKPLPYLPETIGVITSPTGAVIRDILHRIADRFPVRVIVWPVLVQGEGAAAQIAAAIEGFNRFQVPGVGCQEETGVEPETRNLKPDLLIVARGGGSLVDLWAFNEETVVRAAAASQIPLISAVGHETDTTLIDFAADRRAPTPTAAAEMAVPVRTELLAWVKEQDGRLYKAVSKRIAYHKEQVSGLARGLPNPASLLANSQQRLDDFSERLVLSLPRFLERKRERMEKTLLRLTPRSLHHTLEQTYTRLLHLHARALQRMQHLLERHDARVSAAARMLESMNYQQVLKRGFALVRTSDSAVVSSVAQAQGTLRIQFHDGETTVAARPQGTLL